MNSRQIFLAIAAIGLVPIALSYGFVPEKSLPWLYDIVAGQTQSLHFFRAVMGLYLGFALFWLLGALRPWLTFTALISLVIFTTGLAAGRAVSFMMDGLPHGLLLMYFFGELLLAALGMHFLLKPEPSSLVSPRILDKTSVSHAGKGSFIN